MLLLDDIIFMEAEINLINRIAKIAHQIGNTYKICKIIYFN